MATATTTGASAVRPTPTAPDKPADVGRDNVLVFVAAIVLTVAYNLAITASRVAARRS